MRGYVRGTTALALSVAVGFGACGHASSPFPYLTYSVPRVDHDGFGGFGEPGVRSAALRFPREQQREKEPGISLTADDGTGLQLVKLQARGVVDGPLAFTELRMTFRNPSKRRLEGRFQLTLPPEAAVSRLAMRIGDEWREAEVVERQRAREVYESYLHQQVDPAMLEHDAGNVYRARIFPIQPREDKEIVISYSHELPTRESPFVLPLAGLPAIEVFEMNVLTPSRHVRARQIDWKPTGDISIVPDEAPDGLRHGDMIVVRVTPEVAVDADVPEDLLILVDSSASAGHYYYHQARAVHALVAELPPALPVRVVAFDQEVVDIYDGPARGFGRDQVDRLLMRRALGASDVRGALAYAASSGHRRALLVSDGIATAGPVELGALRAALAPAGTRLERLDALPVGVRRDASALHELVTGVLPRAGVVLEADTEAAQWAVRMSRATAAPLVVDIEGADWVWPRELAGVLPGDSAVIYARLPGAGDRLTVKLRGGAAQEHAIALAGAEAPLLAREHAQARIARLLHERSRLAEADTARRAAIDDEIVALSLEHRVLTPHTALLVLETDADYARFGLARGHLADVLSVDATGVRVINRGGFQYVGARRAPTAVVAGPAPAAGRGQLRGVVLDYDGAPLPGATIVATSPVMAGSLTAITDESGAFAFTDVAPGTYQLAVYYADVTMQQSVVVTAGGTLDVRLAIDTNQSSGEVITLSDDAPSVGVHGSATAGVGAGRGARSVPTRDYSSKVATGGASPDAYGVSFGGSTALENEYVIDGIDNDAPGFQLAAASPMGAARSSTKAYAGRYATIMKRLRKGDSQGALVEAIDWHADEPANALALIALGEALEARGCHGLAARAYGSLIDLFSSRADMRRVAAGRLLRLGAAAIHLVVDDLEKAVEARPDHPTGYRMLAYAYAQAGEPRRGVELLVAALDRTDGQGRFARDAALLRRDAGLIAADWLQREPKARDAVRALLGNREILVPMETSMYVVLTWETDANDVDLYVTDGSSFERARHTDGRYWGNVTNGYGPEVYSIEGHPTGTEYHLWAHYRNRGAMGFGFGQVQIVLHDGSGHLHIDTRPFVVMTDDAYVDLGLVGVK